MPSRWDVERAVTGSNIDSRGRLIVLALLTKADNDTARTTPEHTPAFSTICAMTGLSKAVVSEWMGALEDGGWVVRTSPSGGKGNRTLYTLLPGSDKIERRSRDLRVPRKSRNSSPSEPFGDAATVRPADGKDDVTVRPANGMEGSNSSPSEPLTVRPADLNSSPGERATSTIKNHQTVPAPAPEPEPRISVEEKPSKNWAQTNRQDPPTGNRIPRQPTLFAPPAPINVDAQPKHHQIVIRWFQSNGYPNITLTDVAAVIKAVRDSMNGQTLTWQFYAGISHKSGFARFYQPILDARAAVINTAIRKLTEVEPDCHHGTPAGAAPHPTTGQMLCPRCRNGEPAAIQKLGETTHPDVEAALAAYKAASPRRFDLARYLRITHEATVMHNKGAAYGQLVEIARRAATTGCGFLEAAQSMKGQLV